MPDQPVPDLPVCVADREVEFDEALSVVLGYCLGRDELRWSKGTYSFGVPPKDLDWGMFAYRTYDCIKGSADPGLQPIDVLVADGLNAKMVARNVAGALAVADDVSVELRRIGDDVEFWNLSPSQVTDPPSPEDEVAWPIWRAWWLLRGVPGLNIARVHKILHHKRPRVFPLLDRKTKRVLHRPAWSAIHDDLNATPIAWEALEEEVNPRLTAAGGEPLTRLRLHDILVWTQATGNWVTARDCWLNGRSRA